MNTNEIAKALLNRRNTMNPVVMQGEMISVLQSEGLREALERRWLVPDVSSGYLLVSQDMTKVLEMRALAEQATEEKPEPVQESTWNKTWAQPDASHDAVMTHSVRNINELLSPGTGHDSGGPLTAGASSAPTAPPPATPTAPPTAMTPAGPEKPGVGDEVVVVSADGGASESQTFTGKISSAANGRVKISFGGSGGEREYPENEVKVIKKAGL
jgi:hypothetical protein